MQRTKRKSIILITALVLILVLIGLSVWGILTIQKNNAYENAMSLMRSGQYEAASAQFLELNGYKDSIEQMVKGIPYHKALDLLNAEEYEKAIDAFADLGSYLDSEDRAEEARQEQEEAEHAAEEARKAEEEARLRAAYDAAAALLNEEKYEEAAAAFTELIPYADSESMVTECSYRKAISLLNEEATHGDAYVLFEALGDYADSKQYRSEFALKSVSQSLNLEKITTYFFYDPENRLIRKLILSDIVTEYQYEYDEEGKLVTEYYLTTGSIGNNSITQYQYNEQGQCIKEIQLNDQDEVDTTTNIFDGNGLMIESQHAFSDGDTAQTLYYYDEEGRQEKTVYTSDSMTITDLYSYHGNGTVSQNITSTKSSYIDRTTTRTYNEKGHPTGYQSDSTMTLAGHSNTSVSTIIYTNTYVYKPDV